MKSLKSLLLLFFVLGFTAKASAGLYLNPYISYEAGTWTNTFGSLATTKEGVSVAGQTFTGGLSGSGMGLVLAYSLPAIFYFGVDYSTGSVALAVKTDPTGQAESATMNRTTMFAVVGAKLVLIKVWAGYSLSDSFKDSEDTYKGSATKVGLAWSMLPLVDLNFEYVMHSIKEASGSANYTVGPDQIFSKSEYNSLNVGVSVPFNF